MTTAKRKTKGFSPDLLKPVSAAVVAAFTTLLVSHQWHVSQTVLLISAGATFFAGYFVGPTPLDSTLAKLRLSKKLIAAFFVAIGTAVVSTLVTGAWNAAEWEVVVAAVVGIAFAALQPPDQTKPAA